MLFTGFRGVSQVPLASRHSSVITVLLHRDHSVLYSMTESQSTLGPIESIKERPRRSGASLVSWALLCRIPEDGPVPGPPPGMAPHRLPTVNALGVSVVK